VGYRFSTENLAQNIPEFLPLYVAHYSEMQDRLANDGVQYADFNPRYDQYVKGSSEGYLLQFVARTDEGEAVGYANVWLTNDMHNGEFIAREDLLYVRKDHRNGLVMKLVKYGLEELRKRGLRRLLVQAMTDLRVEKLWRRIGFKPVAVCMVYTFDGN